jgi:hypothetical protein
MIFSIAYHFEYIPQAPHAFPCCIQYIP